MDLALHLRSKIQYYFNPLIRKDKCECCGTTEQLEVHHIYTFKNMLIDTLEELNYQLKDTNEYTELELLNIEEKMIGKHLLYKYKTLCRSCHDKEHNKNSKKDIIKKEIIKQETKTNEYKKIIEKYLDRQLTAQDKDTLCEELNKIDKKGRLIKWNRTKEWLKEEGFEIKEKTVRDKVTKKSVRVTIITWSPQI